ncbi:bacterial sugar transferase [Lentimicrobium saccharophilum]|uniref:Bacterial sugar transferase n=1 Tax=Lentimicrobium saccharophilum TaxID=1678841 RepID=A0A0S7BV04_9BACT|nr:sugar transferase [Lentimicrobium saccharophilum]GAP42379.1 bacterial sugar transferase [Lentimicrobium saccharophilum]
MKRLYRQLLTDIAICSIVFIASLAIHSNVSLSTIRIYGDLALFFYGLHLFISLVFRKYETNETYSTQKLLVLYSRSWMYSSGIALLLIYTLQLGYLSRLLVLFNIFGLLSAEMLVLVIRLSFRSSLFIPDSKETTANEPADDAASPSEVIRSSRRKQILEINDEVLEEVGEEALFFIAQFIDAEPGKTLILNTTTRFNIVNQPEKVYQKIVNLHRLNDVRFVNKFLEAINSRLPEKGLVAVCAETKNQRKERILKKYPPLLNYGYYAIDFLIKRVLPKLPVGKKLYFFLTHGHNRVMSRAEILGRICSCGFSIEQEQKLGGKLYVIARKVKQPAFNENATYGPFIYLNRVGKNGKMIKVYKFRTMHPYSEYLQDYIYNNNNLDEGGKIKDDYRVTTLGRILRKIWLDELPMLINVLKGEMKIVGVRPLSQHYFNLYSPEMQEMRTRCKPGLVPPFYADMPKTFEEIEASERRYLEAYRKSPFLTDVRYFFRAFYNIIFKRARSN